MATFTVDVDGFLSKVTLTEGERECVLPDEVEGISIVGIGSRVFTADVKCESVVLNSGCEEIRPFAFFNCGTLRRLSIGDGLKTISPHAFAYRNNLESVSVADGNEKFSAKGGCLYTADGKKLVLGVNSEEMKVDSACEEIGDCAFSYCGGIRLLQLPANLSIIGEHSFCDCCGIENIYIGNKVKNIGRGAFFGCDAVETIAIAGTADETKVDLLKETFAEIGDLRVLNLTGRTNEIALLLGDGTFANTDIETLCDTTERKEWPYAHNYIYEEGGATVNVAFTAKNYNPDGKKDATGSKYYSIGMPYGDFPIKPIDNTGYDFLGWFYVDEEEYGSLPVTPDSIVPMPKEGADQIKIAAKYAVQKFDVKFLNGSKVVEEHLDVPYGTTITSPKAPSASESLVFQKWEAEGGEIVVGAEMPYIVTKSVTFEADFVSKDMWAYRLNRQTYTARILGFNVQWDDENIKYELETDHEAHKYSLNVPSTIEQKEVVATVDGEPQYETKTYRVTGIGCITDEDKERIKPFGHFGTGVVFERVEVGTNCERVYDEAFKNVHCDMLVLPFALTRIGEEAFYCDEQNGAIVRMETQEDDGVSVVGQNFVSVGKNAFYQTSSSTTVAVSKYVANTELKQGQIITGGIDVYARYRVDSDIELSDNTSWEAVKDRCSEYFGLASESEKYNASVGYPAGTKIVDSDGYLVKAIINIEPYEKNWRKTDYSKSYVPFTLSIGFNSNNYEGFKSYSPNTAYRPFTILRISNEYYYEYYRVGAKEMTEADNTSLDAAKKYMTRFDENHKITLGEGAFKKAGIYRLSISPKQPMALPKYVFADNENAYVMDFPDSETQSTSIGEGAFQNCRHLSYPFGSSTATKVGAFAYENCISLQFTPGKVPEYPFYVTSIGERAYFGTNWDVLDSEFMRNTNIGKEAFAETHCTTSYFSIQNPVSIKEGAFRGIFHPNPFLIYKYDSYYDIGKEAFKKATLGKVSIAGVREIKEGAFLGARGNDEGEIELHIAKDNYDDDLPSITGCDYIGNYAFAGCRTKQMVISGSYREIGKYAFEWWMNPNQEEEVYASAPEVYQIGSSVSQSCTIVTLGAYAFAYNPYLSHFVYIRSQSIGANAFRMCYDMRYFRVGSIGDGTKCQIGDGAFYLAESMKGICFNTAEIQDIGYNAFKIFDQSESKDYEDYVEKEGTTNPILFWKPLDGVYGLNLMTGEYWEKMAAEEDVQEEITKYTGYTWIVAAKAKKGVLNLTNSTKYGKDGKEYPPVNAGKYIAGIAGRSFRMPTNPESTSILTDVYLPEYSNEDKNEGGVTRLIPRISKGAFSGFSSLTVYMSSPCSFAEGAFDVGELTLYTDRATIDLCEFDSGLFSIGTGTVIVKNLSGGDIDGILYLNKDVAVSQYQSDSSVSRICILNGCTTIGSYAFYNCANLKEITFRNQIQSTVLNAYSFYNCYGLKKLVLENKYNLKAGAFSTCTGLQRVVIKSAPATYYTSISTQYAIFAYCIALREFEIDTGATPTIIGFCGTAFFMAVRNLQRFVVTSSTCYLAKGGMLVNKNIYMGHNAGVVLLEGVCGDVVVPDGIKIIYNCAFLHRIGLTSIVLPAGITEIGSHAFYGCTELLEMSFPKSVVSIGSEAFRNCSALMKITLAGSAPEVGDNAFGGVHSQCVAWIPQGDDTYIIEDGKWNGLDIRYLASYTVEDGVLVAIDPGDEEAIEIPEGVESIADDLLWDGSNVKSIRLPSTLKSIGTDFFSGMYSIESIEVAEGNSSYSAVNGCLLNADGTVLQQGVNGVEGSVTVPSSVTKIWASAFDGLEYLRDITIPDSVESIGDYAFSGCTGLTSITIPQVVCTSGLSSVFPDSYQSITNVVISDSVESIGNEAFSGCTGLTSVTIPQVVCTSGLSSVFPDSYQNITNVVISDSVKSIGEWAFSDCSGLMSVTIPSSVTSIGEGAFGGCYSLTSVDIPEGVTSIGNYTFDGCSGLTSVTIPEGVTSIGYEAFYRCSELTSVTIPPGVTSIGGGAFADCIGLTSITIPSRVTSIENDTFAGCTALTSVTIFGSVTRIGSSAFSGCSALTSVTIPSSVTNIGYAAFYRCSELTSVTIPSRVTGIGSSAFYGCSGLTSVTMKGDCPTVGSSAFYSVSSSCVVYLPSGNNTYVVTDDKWQGMAVERYDP